MEELHSKGREGLMKYKQWVEVITLLDDAVSNLRAVADSLEGLARAKFHTKMDGKDGLEVVSVDFPKTKEEGK